jgi:hypothetical protein
MVGDRGWMLVAAVCWMGACSITEYHPGVERPDAGASNSEAGSAGESGAGAGGMPSAAGSSGIAGSSSVGATESEGGTPPCRGEIVAEPYYPGIKPFDTTWWVTDSHLFAGFLAERVPFETESDSFRVWSASISDLVLSELGSTASDGIEGSLLGATANRVVWSTVIDGLNAATESMAVGDETWLTISAADENSGLRWADGRLWVYRNDVDTGPESITVVSPETGEVLETLATPPDFGPVAASDETLFVIGYDGQVYWRAPGTTALVPYGNLGENCEYAFALQDRLIAWCDEERLVSLQEGGTVELITDSVRGVGATADEVYFYRRSTATLYRKRYPSGEQHVVSMYDCFVDVRVNPPPTDPTKYSPGGRLWLTQEHVYWAHDAWLYRVPR